jgi:hypothetical protein
MRLIVTTAFLAATLVMPAWRPAGAQDPVKLPKVTVTASIDKPGPRLVVGIVVDTSGNPLAGAEVTIPGLARRLYTQADGSFRFDSIPRGKHDMRARKMGFAALVKKVEVDAAGGVGEFQLAPVTQALPSMVSSASRGGIDGHVSDMEDRDVTGATVRVLGSGLTAITDQNGNFSFAVDSGRYMLGIVKDSFVSRVVGLTVPKDSGRHVEAWMVRGQPDSFEKMWVVENLRERQAWTREQDRVLFTHEDLAVLGIEWIYDAIALTQAKFHPPSPYSRDCRVVVDGGPETVNLPTLTIDDVESVEVYPNYASSITRPTAAAVMPRRSAAGSRQGAAQVNDARRAIIQNGARNCPGIYVWMR